MSKSITSISVDGGVLSTPSSPWLAITGCSEPSQEKFIPEVLAWLRSCIKEVLYMHTNVRMPAYSVRFEGKEPRSIRLYFDGGEAGFFLGSANPSSSILGAYNLFGGALRFFGDFSETPSFLSHPDWMTGTEYYVEFNADCPTPILDICKHLNI